MGPERSQHAAVPNTREVQDHLPLTDLTGARNLAGNMGERVVRNRQKHDIDIAEPWCRTAVCVRNRGLGPTGLGAVQSHIIPNSGKRQGKPGAGPPRPDDAHCGHWLRSSPSTADC